jgi:hypothetical protein
MVEVIDGDEKGINGEFMGGIGEVIREVIREGIREVIR